MLSEIALRFFPFPDPHADLKTPYQALYIASQFPPYFRFETTAEAGLHGVTGHNVFSINNLGFRGDPVAVPKPDKEFRIFIVGGSTAECLYLDDTQALNSVLQTELKIHGPMRFAGVRVYNAAKSGDRSDDHIAMITQKILHLQPDMIIVFAGVNDLLAAMRGYDFAHRASPVGNQLGLNLILRMAATEFQLPRRLDYVVSEFVGRERRVMEQIKATSDYREKAKLAMAAPETSVRPSVDLEAYRINLRTIAGALQSQNVPLIFMTQASTWNSAIDPAAKAWHWLINVNGTRYREDQMDQALEEYNDVMREVARNNGIRLYDLAQRLPKSLAYMYDDVHFNTNGVRVATEQLANVVIDAVPGSE